MPRKPDPQYYAVRLRQSSRNEVNGFDFGGFIDMLRYDAARVVSTIPERGAIWIVLEGRCTRERWTSMGIPVFGPLSGPADISRAVAEHLKRVEEALA